MSEQLTGLYGHPDYYDVLFKRDYGAETDFLAACLHRHGKATERSFVELGCGPARNAREIAKRGYRAVALDLELRMLEYAQAAASREGVSLDLVQGSMIDFALSRPVAMAACLWDTILLVLTNDDMVRHLRSVARNLLPGGIYVIETSHPRLAWQSYRGFPYRGQVGDTEIEMTWGLPSDPYDCIAQQHDITIRTVLQRNGQVVSQLEDRLKQRSYQPQELRALIELSGAFSEIHQYGATTLPFLPLSDSPECDGWLLVLVKAPL